MHPWFADNTDITERERERKKEQKIKYVFNMFK